jgi:hypothetical protein
VRFLVAAGRSHGGGHDLGLAVGRRPASPSESPSGRRHRRRAPTASTRTLGRLTLAEQAGQVLMVGTSVDAPSGLG